MEQGLFSHYCASDHRTQPWLAGRGGPGAWLVCYHHPPLALALSTILLTTAWLWSGFTFQFHFHTNIIFSSQSVCQKLLPASNAANGNKHFVVVENASGCISTPLFLEYRIPEVQKLSCTVKLLNERCIFCTTDSDRK